jgi:hypothetical protein
MGFEKALILIPSREVFGDEAEEQAYRSIIQRWMSEDSIACSKFIRDCPAGERRNNYIQALVENLARTGYMEDAMVWYRQLPEGSRQAVSAKIVLDDKM